MAKRVTSVDLLPKAKLLPPEEGKAVVMKGCHTSWQPLLVEKVGSLARIQTKVTGTKMLVPIKSLYKAPE